MKPRLELIAAATAFAVGVPPSALRSRSRKRLIVAARRAYGLIARFCGYSYPKIAAAVGLNHSSILMGVRAAGAHERALAERAAKSIGVEL